jgi:hypothetical protein
MNHDHYYAIDAIKLRMVRMDGPYKIYSSRYDSMGTLFHYYNLSPETEIYDSLNYGIFINEEIGYCYPCHSYSANALTQPGEGGTRQKIKSIRLFLVDNKTNMKKEITNLPHGNDSLKSYGWKSTESMYLGGSVGGKTCASNDCSVFTSSSFPNLKSFQDTFNLNEWKIYRGGTDLIFSLGKDIMKSFPQDFTLSMEIEFENGKKISSETKCTKK